MSTAMDNIFDDDDEDWCTASEDSSDDVGDRPDAMQTQREMDTHGAESNKEISTPRCEKCHKDGHDTLKCPRCYICGKLHDPKKCPDNYPRLDCDRCLICDYFGHAVNDCPDKLTVQSSEENYSFRWWRDRVFIHKNIHGFLEAKNYDGLISVLNKFDKYQRKFIMATNVDNELSPLCIAIESFEGSLKIIEYFIEECDADIDQAVFTPSFNGLPLSLAIYEGHYMVAVALINYGANIHKYSSIFKRKYTSSIFQACQLGALDILKYMVTVVGLDINMFHYTYTHQHVTEITALMAACKHKDICEYLINNGADVNKHDALGHCAINYAVREGTFEDVDCLLKHGAEVTQNEKSDDDILMVAAVHARRDMVEFLIERMNEPLIRVIHAYEVLGACFRSGYNELRTSDEAEYLRLSYFVKAMTLRYHNKCKPMLEYLTKEERKCFDSKHIEAQTIKDLNRVFTNPMRIVSQRAMLIIRVLGNNINCITGLQTLFNAYGADDIRVFIWTHELRVIRNNPKILLDLGVQAIRKPVFDVKLGLDQLKGSMEIVQKLESYSGSTDRDIINTQQLLLQVGLDTAFWLWENHNVKPSHPTIQNLIHVIEEFAHGDPDGNIFLRAAGQCLVHRNIEVFQCLKDNSMLFSTDSVETASIVLMNLAKSASSKQKECDMIKIVIDELLQQGAHTCLTDHDGRTFMDILPKKLQESYRFLFPKSLQCLSALKLAEYSIVYEKAVPSKLAKFVKIHKKNERTQEYLVTIQRVG